MLVPRRVRRRLLLPPGWVALGFLLLLGCQALRPWQQQLKPWNVMPLTMPALHIDNEAPWNKVVYQSPKQLNSFRPWHDVEFRGKNLLNFLNAATTESAVRQIIADTNHAGGVRIRFLPGATYANLVKVFDIMLYTDQKKYWLDIHHQPTTLYAITDEPLPRDTLSRTLYFWCDDVIMSPPIPEKPTLHRLVVEFEQELMNLRERNWRLSILLVVLLSGLSLWRLIHHKSSYYNS